MNDPFTSAITHDLHTNPLSEILERFDVAWRNGDSPRIDDYLVEASSSSERERTPRGEFLEELIKIDLEYRWRQARSSSVAASAPTRPNDILPERPRLEDYAARYPELGTPEILPVDLIREEYRVRRRWGDRPSHDEYADRFRGRGTPLREALATIDVELISEARDSSVEVSAITLPQAFSLRCPHCNGLIEQPAENTPSEVLCPRCGGTFALESRVAEKDLKPPFPKLGRYVLGTFLGSGGFGTVWRGWDEELGREVAVKVPRGGRFTSPAEEERFLREARSAAQFRHPGIVAIHDAGRDQGTVYIVSELVRGTSLAHWKGLGQVGFESAAKLVAEAAEALDYAHRQGVVHRDLKPTNILLEPDGSASGRPRIMDFGLAKRDAGEVTMTQDGQLLGTPAYMSPEQIRSPHHVDGRSDIYSFGVILYLLLTNELPFRGVSQMLQIQVLEDEPRAPRRLNDRIPRDLETITLRCLAKDPSRRYPTAHDLSADLKRFLNGEPVLARPVGQAERLVRHCQRNPRTAALVAALLLAITCGFLGVTWQWLRAEHNYNLAEQRFLDARHAVDDYLTGVSENALLDRPGLEPLRKALLEHALEYYQGFIAARENDATVRAELASAEANVAKITAATGSQRQALASYDRAISSYEALMKYSPLNVNHVKGFADAANNRGVILQAMGRLAEARAGFRRTRDLLENWTRSQPRDSTLRRGLAGVYSNLGVLEEMSGHAREAVANDDRARDLLEALVLEEPNVARHRAALANTCSNLGVLLYHTGPIEKAQANYERARGLQEALVREYPDVTTYRSDLANTCSNLGVLLRSSGHEVEARSSYKQALDLQEALVRDHPAVSTFRAELARTLNNLGRFNQVVGRLDEALANHDRARVLRERLVRDHPEDWEAKSLLASSFNNLGLTFKDLKRTEEALESLRKGVVLQHEALTASKGAVQCRKFLSLNLQELAASLRELGRADEAASVAIQRRGLWPDDSVELYNSACELALCIPLVEPGRTEPSAKGLADRKHFGDQAMISLQEALRVGFKDIAHIYKDTDLDSLHSRSDFQSLLLDYAFPIDPFAH